LVIGWSCGWISGPVLVVSAASLAAAVAAACCASLLGFIFLFLGWSSTDGAGILALDIAEEVVAEIFSKFSIPLSFWFFPPASVFLSDFSTATLHFETIPVLMDSDVILLTSDPIVSGVGEWCLCCGEELFERSVVVLTGNGDEVE